VRGVICLSGTEKERAKTSVVTGHHGASVTSHDAANP
jgi:hypothetical protein